MESVKMIHLLSKDFIMKYELHVPLPCSEQWNQMSENGNGRHCARCSETVTDFTDMSIDEIVAFFHAHQQQKICGRFTSEQLNPQPILPEQYMNGLLQSALPYLKRISAIILFIFCLSTGSYAQQAPPQQPVQTSAKKQGNRLVIKQPNKPDQVIMGKFIAAPKDSVKTPVKTPEQVPGKK